MSVSLASGKLGGPQLGVTRLAKCSELSLSGCPELSTIGKCPELDEKIVMIHYLKLYIYPESTCSVVLQAIQNLKLNDLSLLPVTGIFDVPQTEE
jgi:hypothetical protein